MTTLQDPYKIFSEGARDALVDQLRACSSTHEILEFESWFNTKVGTGPLHEVICEMLRKRSISRGLAAKWLCTILKNKDEQIINLNKTNWGLKLLGI